MSSGEDTRRHRTVLLIVLPLLAALAAGLVVWAACGMRIAELEEERDAALYRVEVLEAEISDLVDSLADDPFEEPADDGDDPATDAEAPGDGAAGETPDGRYFGFIREIDTTGAVPVVIIDFAEMLTGDAAAAAAAAAGEESPPPNDFYISNVNPMLRTFPVEAGIDVSVVQTPVGVEPGGFTISLAEWTERFEGTGSLSERTREMPYWIEVESGTVTSIEEQYLP